MRLLDLFIAASIPVLKVLFVTALGLYLALDRVNILGEVARKHINNLVFYVFNPALVSSNLARTITYESIVKLWFMPFNILLTFIAGSILGWIVIQFTRPPSHLKGLILGCCAAGKLTITNILEPFICGLNVYNIVRLSSTRRPRGTETRDPSAGYPIKEASTSGMGDCNEPFLSSNDNHADRFALPQTVSAVTMKQKVKSLFEKMNLTTSVAPSTSGAIAGFIIGLIPQIRNSVIGDSAPLRVIHDSASLLGDGAIPTLTLVLGANLLRGLQGSGVQKSAVFAIAIARYVALPLIGIFVVKGAQRFGTITQLFGTGESECSVIMLWTYSLASISVTLWATLFMWLVDGNQAA